MTHGPDEHDADLLDDERDVIDCPHCGQEIHADAEQCPKCRQWLTTEDRMTRSRQPWMVWAAVVLMIVFILVYVLGGIG